MLVECEGCEGYGQVISDRSVRQGHTHGNDPDREDVDCEECEGSGKRDATPSDLDGREATYKGAHGYLSWERKNDTLTLETEDGLLIVNLQPEHVQCLS